MTILGNIYNNNKKINYYTNLSLLLSLSSLTKIIKIRNSIKYHQYFDFFFNFAKYYKTSNYFINLLDYK